MWGWRKPKNGQSRETGNIWVHKTLDEEPPTPPLSPPSTTQKVKKMSNTNLKNKYLLSSISHPSETCIPGAFSFCVFFRCSKILPGFTDNFAYYILLLYILYICEMWSCCNKEKYKLSGDLNIEERYFIKQVSSGTRYHTILIWLISEHFHQPVSVITFVLSIWSFFFLIYG